MITIENRIVELLPYQAPFLFVDQLNSVDENGATGQYTLREDEYFYAGHFPQKKVTPGVIIVEIMAQIGLVCHGIYLQLTENDTIGEILPAFTSTRVDFLAPVYPVDTLEVSSSKIYYRFNKLKSEIVCKSLESGKVVCRGEFAGMIITNKDE